MAGAEVVDTNPEMPLDETEAGLFETYETTSATIDVAPLQEALNLPKEEGDSDAVHFVKVMRAVKPTLEPAGLTNAFHDMYLGISEEMLDATTFEEDEALPDPTDPNRRKFADSEDVLHAMPTFGSMYLDPLAHYANYHAGEDSEGLDKIPTPWQEAIIDPELHNMPEIVVAYSGLLAHVNADLRESLRRSDPRDEYYDDYTTVVNNRISDLATEIIEENFAAHPLAQRLAHAVFVRAIDLQRDAAYKSFLELRALQQTAEQAGPGTPDAEEAEENMDLIRWQANERTANQIARFKQVGSLAVRGFEMAEALRMSLPWNRSEKSPGFDDTAPSNV